MNRYSGNALIVARTMPRSALLVLRCAMQLRCGVEKHPCFSSRRGTVGNLNPNHFRLGTIISRGSGGFSEAKRAQENINAILALREAEQAGSATQEQRIAMARYNGQRLRCSST